MMHQSLFVYSGYRYFKLCMLLIVASVIAYAIHEPVDGPNGGTWLGYTLGGLGAFIILLLMWFGMRKRSYKSDMGQVQGWLSAHVYLGLALIVIATLHAGFQIGWNVHTLAYVLMFIVIISGIFGVFAYLRYPELMTKNRRGNTLNLMLTEMSELDRECRDAAAQLTDEINKCILDCCENTVIGGSVYKQLSGKNANCATQAALNKIGELNKLLPKEMAADSSRLMTLLGKKSELVQRARRDVQYKAIMDIWLYFHVPLSFALLAALTAHIVSIFFYW